MKSTPTLIKILALCLCGTTPFTAQAQQPGAAPVLAPVVHQNLGRYERLTVHGASLEGNLEGDSPDRKVSVYLPPGYDRSPRKRYPVLYLLHGYGDDEGAWSQFGFAHRIADNLLANGKMKSMIIVICLNQHAYSGNHFTILSPLNSNTYILALEEYRFRV
jgi:enterochelin esterase-like enzyme